MSRPLLSLPERQSYAELEAEVDAQILVAREAGEGQTIDAPQLGIRHGHRGRDSGLEGCKRRRQGDLR